MRIVSQIDDLMNEVHELLQIKKMSDVEKQKFGASKQYTKPVLPFTNWSKPCEGVTRRKTNEIILNYNSSNYFHVGPRREIFDILKKCFAEDTDNVVTSAEQKREILRVVESYNSSTYFHVGPRRQIFNVVKMYLK